MAALASPPDSGSRATARSLTLAGTSLIAVSFGLARYGYGLFAPQFQRDLHLSTTQIGALSSLSYVGYGLGLLACPWLVRRAGARCPVLSAATCTCVGIGLVAAARATGILALGVMVAGIGVGLAWPPFTTLTADHVRPSRRPRVVSTISTGTSFGLIVAVPPALLAGSRWRIVWVAFGALALLVLVLNIVLLPRGDRPPTGRPPRDRRGVWGRDLRWLATYSMIYGAIGATFFTFAIELARGAHHTRGTSVLLWVIVGATGLAAIRTGDAIDRLGLRVVIGLLMLGTGSGLFCMGMAPTSLVVLDLGAAIFGPAYMAGAAVVPRWSQQIQPQSPALAHTLATAAGAAGSIAAAAAAGAAASVIGLPAIFIATAALSGLCGLTLSRKAPTLT